MLKLTFQFKIALIMPILKKILRLPLFVINPNKDDLSKQFYADVSFGILFNVNNKRIYIRGHSVKFII